MSAVLAPSGPTIRQSIARPSADLIAKASSLDAATLHEAGGRIGVMPSAIKPVAPAMRVCGPAVTVHSPGGDKPPWVVGSLTDLANGHLFYRSLKGKPSDLSGLRTRWASISDARLVEYDNALPQEWRTATTTIQESLDFVRDVRDNIDAAMNEVQRTLQ